jgi:hypothetical protein
MYTIQFAQRAHFLSDAAAQELLDAIRESRPFVTVPIDLAADGGNDYVVTLNVSNIVAIIKHREENDKRNSNASAVERTRLSLVI